MENAETNSSSNNQAQDHEQALSDYGDSEGFEFSSMGLVKRKNFVGIDEAANTNSHRTFYFRNTSGESLIDFCSSILKSKPISVNKTQFDTSSFATASPTHPELSDYDNYYSLSKHEIDSLTKSRLLFVRGVYLCRKGDYELAASDLSEVIRFGYQGGGAKFASIEPLLVEEVSERSEASLVTNNAKLRAKLLCMSTSITDLILFNYFCSLAALVLVKNAPRFARGSSPTRTQSRCSTEAQLIRN